MKRNEPNYIEEALTEHWGKRCPTYAKYCPCCAAWLQYDKLNARAGGVEFVEPTDEFADESHSTFLPAEELQKP